MVVGDVGGGEDFGKFAGVAEEGVGSGGADLVSLLKRHDVSNVLRGDA